MQHCVVEEGLLFLGPRVVRHASVEFLVDEGQVADAVQDALARLSGGDGVVRLRQRPVLTPSPRQNVLDCEPPPLDVRRLTLGTAQGVLERLEHHSQATTGQELVQRVLEQGGRDLVVGCPDPRL